MQTLARFLAAAAALQLLLLPHVSAGTLSAARIEIDPRDLVLNKANVKLTLTFTPTTTLPPSGTITIQYTSGFYATGVTPTMDSCNVPLLSTTFSATDSNNRIAITTSGASIAAGSSFAITIGGLTVGSARTSSQFSVYTSTDSNQRGAEQYESGTRVTQFSMTITDSERIFASAATVTLTFTPSTAVSTSQFITMFFPSGFFKKLGTATFKSSLNNAFLSLQSDTSQYLIIKNGAQSTSPTGATIPANSPITITINGIILGPPMGSVLNSVFVSTSSDTIPSDAVASGSIGLGSYVNGSCPYGMGWSNVVQACTSCGTFICADFSDCLSCVACPYAQAISSESNPPSMLGPPSARIFYSCSNSSTRCPPGSGKQYGDNGGCSPCPYDTYNDGSSDRCQYCPSGTYPTYSIMKASVQIVDRSSMQDSVKTGYVMKKSATSCSPQCPAGTGILSDIKYIKEGVSSVSPFSYVINDNLDLVFSFLWGKYRVGSASSNDRFVHPQKDKGCFPCTKWFISKDNTCRACNEGGSDRASLNTMGDSYAFATRCVPDICPWPYVPPGALQMNYNGPSVFDSDPLSKLCKTNVHLGGNSATIAVIAVVLLGTYAVAISFAAMGQDEALTVTRRRKLVLGMLMTTVSPAVDFISDLMYIVSTLFYNDIICIVCCAFYLLPVLFFWRMLNKHGVHFSFYIGKPPAFALMDKYDSIPKALLGFVGYFPLYIINLPISLPLILVGHVLYCCKVFPIARVSNLWLRLYSRSNKHTSSVNIIVPLLQESIFEEMMTESVPQMAIQIVNNTFTDVWSPLSYFSTAMSAAMILNGIWRMVYYRLYLKIKINAIPSDLSNDVFNFASIEEGESPLGRSLDVKVAPELEMSTIVSAVCGLNSPVTRAVTVFCT
jgi:hypothetical protein